MLAKRKYISAFLSSTRSTTTRSGNKSGNEEEKYFRSEMPRRIPSRYCVSDWEGTQSENFQRGLCPRTASDYSLEHSLSNAAKGASEGVMAVTLVTQRQP